MCGLGDWAPVACKSHRSAWVALASAIPSRGAHAWTMAEDQARPIIRHVVQSGVTFFDTANTYSDGTSEEIVGRAVKDFADREQISACHQPLSNSPVGDGTPIEETMEALHGL